MEYSSIMAVGTFANIEKNNQLHCKLLRSGKDLTGMIENSYNPRKSYIHTQQHSSMSFFRF